MNLYLTKATLDYETAVKAGLRDSYQWHQKIWQAFPDKAEQKRDFLTRIEDTNSGFQLLLLSNQQPDRPDWCPADHWNSKQINSDFLSHGTYRFSIIVNATMKKVERDAEGNRKKNGRRVAIVGELALRDWLIRKAQLNGFSISDQQLEIITMPNQYFIKKGKAGLHAATKFQGILTVTDQSLFQQAFTNGIGTAKAFGFGMLCLSPL